MKAASLCIHLHGEQSLEQALDQRIHQIAADNEKKEKLRLFLESMPAEHINDPGNLLGFIYHKLAA